MPCEEKPLSEAAVRKAEQCDCERCAAPEPVAFAWSGGKDSSMALEAVLADPALRITTLVTTVSDAYDRVSMHGVRSSLLRDQADALGLPLREVRLPTPLTQETYDAMMRETFGGLARDGVRRIIFGDLFLQHLRAYRELQTAQLGLACHFPLWLRDTRELAHDFIARGFRAILVSVDPKQTDASLCGREFDEELLRDLPATCDPCGENGEFHTFVYDGPIFRRPVVVTQGEVVERSGFFYCDLLPAAEEAQVVVARGGG